MIAKAYLYRIEEAGHPVTDWCPDERSAREAALDRGYGTRGRDGKIYLPPAASIGKRER